MTHALLDRVHAHPPRARTAALAIVSFWTVLVVVFGWLEHLLDSKTFPTVWLGMWWATQTVTTVGYGDVVPRQPLGRILGVVLMLGGLSILTVVTASITSVFVSRTQAELKAQQGDPVIEKIEALTSEIAELKAEIARRP